MKCGWSGQKPIFRIQRVVFTLKIQIDIKNYLLVGHDRSFIDSRNSELFSLIDLTKIKNRKSAKHSFLCFPIDGKLAPWTSK